MTSSRADHPNSRLVLGTVQLGMPYGAANATGVPNEADAVAIIRAAVGAGVGAIDTARTYGEAERRIGIALAHRPSVTVVTKLDPLTALAPDADAREAVEAARASLEASRRALDRDRLDVLLLHRATHRTAWGGVVWSVLREHKARGLIGRLGASVQSPSELIECLNDVEVEHVQLPFNILDYRWHDSGCVARRRARPDVTVHARSVYLQGLLAAPKTARWPAVAGIDPSGLVSSLAGLADRLARENIPDLALSYVRAQDWIDGIVIGMEIAGQLANNLAAFAHPPLAPSECTVVEQLPRVPERLLDPSRWPAAGSNAAPAST